MQTPEEYTVRPGTIDSGKPYETRITALLSLRCCLVNSEHFWIASNVKECGDFDDIVLFKKERNKDGVTYLIQMKHEEAGSNIARKEILSTEGKKYTAFSLKKYLETCLKLSVTIFNPDAKISAIINHLREYPKTVYILFTNRNVTSNLDFLKSIKSNSDFINVNGSVYKFKREVLDIITDPYDSNGVFIDKIFLYAKQTDIKKIDEEIKKAFKKLICPLNKSEKELTEILNKFVFFVDEWSKGLLNEHYPLQKTNILKKITEILLEPFMINLGENVPHQREDADKKYNIWNEIVQNKDLIVINGSDDITEEFMKNYLSRFVVKHKESMKKCKTINKILMRVLGNSQTASFSVIYEYFWKTREIPLVIQACSEKQLEEVTDILKLSQDTFTIILLNKTEVVIDNNIKSSKMIFSFSDLKEEQQKKLFNLPIKLQGRYVSGFEKLNVDIKEIYKLRVRDIIHILCNTFSIGAELEALPGVSVDISLSRMWLKREVLQKVIDDVFVIHRKSAEDFEEVMEREILKMNQYENKSNFNFDNYRIILYDNADALKKIENCLRKSEGRSIHYVVSHGNDKLEWVKSWGSIGSIKEFKTSEKCKEKRMMTNKAIINFITEMKSVVVAANQGLIKSVFINYFTRCLPLKFWIVKINLEKYKTVYKNLLSKPGSTVNLKSFFEQILEEECEENLFFAKAIFAKFYESKNVFVILDGFDGLSINYQNDAKRFIKFVNSSSGYCVLVTTRPGLEEDLELLLNTFSLNLNSPVIKIALEK